TRMALGYHGGEYNAIGQFFQIRQKDAHAWVEVHLPDRGWVTYDPTPAAEGGTRRSRNSWLAAARRGYDFLQFEWANAIVSFDAPHRDELLASIKSWFAQFTHRGGDEQTSLSSLLLGPSYFTLVQRLMYWFLLLLIILGVVLAIRAIWIAS